MGATQKVSLTVDRHALRLAKIATDRTGVSLSSIVNTALERHLTVLLQELERRRAAEEVISTFPVKHLPSAAEQRELLAHWTKARPATPAEVDGVRSRPTAKEPSRPRARKPPKRRRAT